MRIIELGEEEGLTPLFTDSVSVYYRGKLINGTVFDQNYTGDLDEKFTCLLILHCRPIRQMD